jgi:hypothetical protein
MEAIYERGRNGKRRKNSFFSGQITAPSRSPSVSLFTSRQARPPRLSLHLSPRARAPEDYQHASARFSSIRGTRARQLDRRPARSRDLWARRNARNETGGTFQRHQSTGSHVERRCPLDPRRRARQISRPRRLAPRSGRRSPADPTAAGEGPQEHALYTAFFPSRVRLRPRRSSNKQTVCSREKKCFCLVALLASPSPSPSRRFRFRVAGLLLRLPSLFLGF